MNFKNTYFFCILFFNALLSQNNLVIFSESTEPFQIQYQQKIFPEKPQSDIKITQITDTTVKIKIIFANKKYKDIDTTLYLYISSKPLKNQDIIYHIIKNNSLVKYLATLPSSDFRPVIPEIDTSAVVKTKEEKSIQKIIFLNDTATLCLQPTDTSDFNKAILFIQKTPNVDRKMYYIENFIKHNCFNQQQAQLVMEQVPFEVEKLKITKLLIPKITNVFDLWNFKDNLKNPIARQSFIEYYTQHLNNLQNLPSLNDSLMQYVTQQLSSFSNDQAKINFLKTIFSHYSLSLPQLETLISTIRHDQSKEELLKCAYYSLKDKTDFIKATSLLQFNESRQRLKNFYEQQKK
ncbi:MAG: DUF4476 domain-containing protein [Bacteroidetes bacterium]|nr:MAG: DUF4476 domain-containing protein [Bacteroidota bacterium]